MNIIRQIAYPSIYAEAQQLTELYSIPLAITRNNAQPTIDHRCFAVTEYCMLGQGIIRQISAIEGKPLAKQHTPGRGLLSFTMARMDVGVGRISYARH